MNFPNFIDHRLDAEDALRGCQYVMLRLLRIFDAICNEIGCKYWLDSGTLLGAVRHGGFIPWDDDLDVAMLADDYCKFLSHAPKLLPRDIFLQQKKSDTHYDLPFAKLMDRYSLLDSPKSSQSRCMNGIFIDIQPMDIFTDRQRRQRKLLYLIRGDFGAEEQQRSMSRRLKRRFLKILRSSLRTLQFDQAVENYLKMGEKQWVAYDLSFQRWWPSFHELDTIFPLGDVSFESFSFPAPAKVDTYLRAQFGNYWDLPPPEQRRPVHSGGIHLTGPNLHKEGLPWPGRA
jgi:lipopolysaccharide cholinephosphotransferase